MKTLFTAAVVSACALLSACAFYQPTPFYISTNENSEATGSDCQFESPPQTALPLFDLSTFPKGHPSLERERLLVDYVQKLKLNSIRMNESWMKNYESYIRCLRNNPR